MVFAVTVAAQALCMSRRIDAMASREASWAWNLLLTESSAREPLMKTVVTPPSTMPRIASTMTISIKVTPPSSRRRSRRIRTSPLP